MPALEITGSGDADLALIRAVAAGQAVSIAPGPMALVRRNRAEAIHYNAGGSTWPIRWSDAPSSADNVGEMREESRARRTD